MWSGWRSWQCWRGWGGAGPAVVVLCYPQIPAVKTLPVPPASVVLPSMLLPPWANVLAVPLVVASVKPVAAVVRGLPVKSRGLRPPRASIVPLAAVALTVVVGVDGRVAA